MKFNKDQVEEYFNLKVGRAVDRIFTENSVKSIYDFYASLQDYKKNNTLSLRNTLQQNYDKMLYCSDLMEKVKAYAGEVQIVAKQIEQELGEEQNKKVDDQMEGHEIVQIERIIKKGEFAKALKCVKQLMRDGAELKATDRYYLKYLKLQIVTKMQKFMDTHVMSKKHLMEYVECLQQLIFVRLDNKQQFGFHEGLGRLCNQQKMPSILAIVGKKCRRQAEIQQAQQTMTASDCKKICLETFFQYKLHLLSRQCKGTISSEPFEQYFQDLLTLLRQSTKDPSFHKIFVQAIPNIKRQLATVFISRNQQGQIIFNCDLYDHVISSQSFAKVLAHFHGKMIETGAQIDNPITFIRELWQDYFINLIDYSFDALNPVPIAQKLGMYSMPYEKLPPQLRAYLYDRSIENTISALAQYQNKLSLFSKNIVPALTRCSKIEKQKMAEKFTNKIDQILNKISTKLSDLLEGDVKQEHLRKFILLCTLLQSLLNKCEQICRVYSLWANPITLSTVFSQNYDFKKLYSVFTKKQVVCSKDSHYSFVDFDAFFVGYLQSSSDNQIIKILKLVIQTFCLAILKALQKQQTGRHQDLLTHTIESIIKHKEQITVMEYILIPYVAEYVCGCQISNKRVIDESVFNRHFCSNKKSQYGQLIDKMVEDEPEDDFEIGDKEDNQEIVRIGKSFITAGTNFISGLMPKKK